MNFLESIIHRFSEQSQVEHLNLNLNFSRFLITNFLSKYNPMIFYIIFFEINVLEVNYHLFGSPLGARAKYTFSSPLIFITFILSFSISFSSHSVSARLVWFLNFSVILF